MKTKKSLFGLIILISSSISVIAQQYKDYIGAGHNIGMTVTSSSNSHGTSANKLLDASGLDAKVFDASRFAAQATFGQTLAQIQNISIVGYTNWINDQFTKAPSTLLPTMNSIWNQIYALDNEAYGPYALHFNYAWSQTNMTNQDLLRHRVAYALSQILVTSATNNDLREWGEAMSSYYDIFVTKGFDNYKDILLAVTKHPAMGHYLSHFNNPKEDVAMNIHPDQNYAREIMQLFTIGLFQLNQDGTYVLDALGKQIPTYNNEDIRQLARVFTGMGGGAGLTMGGCNGTVEFGTNIYCVNKTVPMAMYGWAHQSGPKSFLSMNLTGRTTYTNSQAMLEVDSAVTYLFNHPNTAPFVSYRLIQRLVTSNPSPAYVGRIAAKFANNGSGVRGDMKEVIKAILLDEEARSVAAYNQENGGKLKEPFLRFKQVAKSLPVLSHRGRFWNNGYNMVWDQGQYPMHAPSVFNFYSPDFQPVGDLVDLGLEAPEFKIHNTSTSLKYFNKVNEWAFSGSVWDNNQPYGGLMSSWEGTWPNDQDGVWIDFTYMTSIANDSEDLINYLDKVFTHGQLTDKTRNLLRTTLNQYYYSWNTDWKVERARLGLYLILTSPDFTYSK
jgi:uncharacterized protein (DUF1800 family)